MTNAANSQAVQQPGHKSPLTEPIYAQGPLNRGVYIADNYHFLQSLNSESIDLCVIDPPFAKNETFGRRNPKNPDPLKPPLSALEQQTELELLARWGIHNQEQADQAGINWPETRYHDIWSWEKDIHENWLTDLKADHPAIAELIEAAALTHSDSTAAYLCYMAVRLLEIHRVLKATGSLYLHCDHTANGYLRMLLDAVFGHQNFRNEITWRRTYAHNEQKQYGRTSDTILFYSKSTEHKWNRVLTPYTEEYKGKYFNYSDERGIFQPITLTGAGTTRAESGSTWKGYNPTDSGRHWSIPRRIIQQLVGEKANQLSLEEKMNLLEREGYIYWPKEGNTPRVKQYLHEMKGTPVQDIWTDIGPLSAHAAERTGYPTQKPVALSERIIKASTNEGDVVLDCFAGCAYVPVAAERLNRRWLACDLNPRAWTVFKRQFSKPSLALLDCQEETHDQYTLGEGFNGLATVHGPNELPVRTDPEHNGHAKTRNLPTPERKFKVPAANMPNQLMLQKLLELSGYQAWCCGFANRKADGTVVQTTNNFHLDHINPKSVSGSGWSNDITNRAPLCPHHNIQKSNRRVGLYELRQEIEKAGELLVDSVRELKDLDQAHHQALQLHLKAELDKQQPFVQL